MLEICPKCKTKRILEEAPECPICKYGYIKGSDVSEEYKISGGQSEADKLIAQLKVAANSSVKE